MKHLIVSAVLLSGLTNANAQSCLRTFDTNHKDERATCITTDSLFQNLEKREIGQGFMRVYESFISEFPGAGTALTLIKEITGHDEAERASNQRFVEELHGVLDRYENETRFLTDTSDPQTLIHTSRLSIAAYSELGVLLKDKRFTDVEREIIREKMEKLRNVAALMVTEASVGITSANSVKLAQEMEAIKKDLIERIEKIEHDYLNLKETTVTELAGKVNELTQNLEKTNDAAEKLLLETELKEAKMLLQRTIDSQIKDIRHYATFANGLLSVYSLFEPEKAQRLNQAISGLTQISAAYIQFSNIGSMSTAAVLGNYGTMAMGSVQLMNAFSNKADAQGEAFNKIFKQLIQISKQIEGLQINMNARFDAMSNQLMSVERTIIANLESLHKKVNRIEAMSEYGVNTLNKIDMSLRDLIDYVTSNDIAKEIKSSYLVHVNKCIGSDRLEFVASMKERKACFEGINTWLRTKLNSSQLTKKMVDGQYRSRNLFEYQINDVVDYYKSFRPQSKVDSLSNPLLLNDVERSIELLNNNYTFGVSNKDYKSAKGYINNEKIKLGDFQRTISEDKEFFKHLLSDYKKSLVATHGKITRAYENSVNGSSLSYSTDKLTSFIQLLRNEIAYRRDVEMMDESNAKNPSEIAYIRELKFTQQTMKNMIEQAEISLANLSLDGDPVLFAESCSSTADYRIPLPLSKKFLISKIGEDLYRRIALRPESFKPCYAIDYLPSMNIKQGGVTYGISNDAFNGMTLKHKAFSQIRDYITHPESGITVTGSIMKPYAYTGVRYAGKFIGKFHFKASFEGKEILDETMDMVKIYYSMNLKNFQDPRIKLPLYKGKPDPFGLVGLYSGKRYYEKYPYNMEQFKGSYYHNYKDHKLGSLDATPVPETGGLVAFADSFYDSVLFKNMTTTQKVQNMLSTLALSNQKEIYQSEKESIMSKVQTDFLESLKMVETQTMDENLRMLNLAVYFKNPALYELDEEMTLIMSEMWGLRSGINLKNFYADVFAMNKTQLDLERVFESQVHFIKDLEEKLELTKKE